MLGVMSARPLLRESIPGADLTVDVIGCPDDGREYIEIEPDTPVKGARVVWYSTNRHGHRWGYIVSAWPLAGEHVLDRSRPIEDRALYWLEVVADEDMPEYLRAEGREAQVQAMILVATNVAWLAPVEGIPSQRSGRNA